ncbi:MAG: FkbM family methyltransferase [Elusimicrobia bacterium]|nr:FkbM family methyltransferase [Candidatus Liberimonas magnetica]
MGKLRYILRGLRYKYDYDPGEINCLQKYIKSGDVVVDIGAHFGGYTFWMANQVGDKGKVYVFEPQPFFTDYIRKSLPFWHKNRVIIEQKGMSSKIGEMQLIIAEDGQEHSQCATFESEPRKKYKSYNVPVDTLDNYFKGKINRPIKFIKCDVEGHELEVFRGGIDIIKEGKPILLFECEKRHLTKHKMQDVFIFLQGLGYEGQFILGKKLYPISEFNPDIHQFEGKKPYANNFLFKNK